VTSEGALAQAVAHLNRRDRTEAELRAHLRRRGQSEEDVDAAVAEVIALGWVDDARYARLFVQDKRALEQWGSERIRRALDGRGVERSLIEEALRGGRALRSRDAPQGEEAGPGEEHDDELDRALALLRRRFPSPPADGRVRDRALGMLIRKGFDGDLALDALSAYARERSVGWST
jgi:regulatory protein